MTKSLGETLNALRRQRGLTQQQLSEMLGQRGIDILPAGISKWEKGLTQPSASQFLALCAIYNVGDIMAEFTDGDTPMSRLNARGRRLVYDYINVLDLSGLYREDRREEKGRVLPLYTLAVSAGTGQTLDGDDCDQYAVGDEVPLSADFGVRVAGDSMEPRIRDGSIVWVHRTEILQSGRTGVFDFNGQAYCKVLEQSEKGTRLISENPAYAPIEVSDFAFLRVFGEVVALSAPEQN